MRRKINIIVFSSVFFGFVAFGLVVLLGWDLLDRSDSKIVVVEVEEGSGDLDGLRSHIGQPISQLERLFRIHSIEVTSETGGIKKKWLFKDENNKLYDLEVRDGKMIRITAIEDASSESLFDGIEKGYLNIETDDDVRRKLRGDSPAGEEGE